MVNPGSCRERRKTAFRPGRNVAFPGETLTGLRRLSSYTCPLLGALGNLTVCRFQTTEWLDDSLQQEESEVQEGRVLLEKEEGREDDQGGPHEAEGAGRGGKAPGRLLSVVLQTPFSGRGEAGVAVGRGSLPVPPAHSVRVCQAPAYCSLLPSPPTVSTPVTPIPLKRPVSWEAPGVGGDRQAGCRTVCCVSLGGASGGIERGRRGAV